jgi:oxygen-independent coproporphyrinogen-3 oxidase
MDDYVDRLVEEIELRKDEIWSKPTDTLYLGGGTPSLLSGKHLDRILNVIHRNFSFRRDPEVTIECNPDDLDTSFLFMLIGSGFDRISIGVQTFQESELVLLRRSHNAQQADRGVRLAAGAGFENITIDLMYGIPGQKTEEWELNLAKAIALPVTHISAYHLTYEPGTVLDYWKKKNRIIPLHEKMSIKLYQLMRKKMLSAGFEHYEISNFAKDGRLSEHNQIYWTGEPYLGYGPSAHSFDGDSRSWNVSSLKKYMEGISQGNPERDRETLSLKERYHDYLITALRTSRGADLDYMEKIFGSEIEKRFEKEITGFLEDGTMQKKEKKVTIHPSGWLVTDHILRELFLD